MKASNTYCPCLLEVAPELPFPMGQDGLQGTLEQMKRPLEAPRADALLLSGPIVS